MANMIFVLGGIHSGTTLMATVLGVSSRCLLIPMESAAYTRDHIGPLRKPFVKQVSQLDSEFVVEKTPSNVFNIRAMQEDFPSAKFVVMTRHPVDTVASICNMTGDFNKAIYDCADHMSACLQATKLDNTILVTYESLVKDFRKTVSSVCNFIGIDFENNMNEFHKHSPIWFRKSIHDNDHLRKRSLQMKQPLFDDSGKGYDILSRDQAAQVEFDCLGLYEELTRKVLQWD